MQGNHDVERIGEFDLQKAVEKRQCIIYVVLDSLVKAATSLILGEVAAFTQPHPKPYDSLGLFKSSF